MTDKLKFIEHGGASCHVTYWGNVDDVIAGKLRPEIWEKEISGDSFRYGFELGAVRDERLGDKIDPNQCGECVAAFGTCYSRSTDLKSDLYYKTCHGPSIKTTGLAIVGPSNAKPRFEVVITNPIPYIDLVQSINAHVGNQPYSYGGILDWSEINFTAVCHPPITGENIFEHKDKYYDPKLAGPHDKNNLSTVIHGFAAEMEVIEAEDQKTGRDLYRPLRRVLYVKPEFMKTETEKSVERPLTIHAHLITTDKSAKEVYELPLDKSILPSEPKNEDVYHLNGGIITAGRLEIFLIESMVEHTEFIVA